MTAHITGADVYQALQDWQRLSPNNQSGWVLAAQTLRVVGKSTTGQAEFMAARLTLIVNEHGQEAGS